MAQRVGHQVLHGLDGVIRRHIHGGSRDHFSAGQGLVAQGAAERVLHQQLLQLKIREGDGQQLLVLGRCALRAHDLDGRKAADLHLLLGVGKRFVSESQRLFLHADVLVGVDQVPVHGLDLVDGGNDLLVEGHVGKLAIVFGDADKAGVGGKAKSLQQVLGELEIKTGFELRTERLEGRVANRLASIVETH